MSVYLGIPNAYIYTEYENGGALTLVIKANAGYKFTGTPYFSYMNGDGDYTQVNANLTDDDTTANFYAPYYDSSGNAYGDTTATTPPTPVIPTIYNGVLNTTYTANIDNDDLIIMLKGDFNNYHFVDPLASFINFDGDYTQVPASISDVDGTPTATITITDFNTTVDGEINLQGVFIENEPTFPDVSDYGTINVYKVTQTNLDDFSDVRFGSWVNDSLITEDIGQYVHSLKRLYFDVNTTSTDFIKCGKFETNILVDVPSETDYILNCGDVTIPFKNNNNIDYLSEISVFLPFIGMVTVNSEYVGKTINLKYKIDIVTGEGVVELTADDVLISKNKVRAFDELIYKIYNTNLQTIGGDNWNTNKLLGLKPFVILKYFNSTDENEIKNCSIQTDINDVTGFASFEQVKNLHNALMTNEEKHIILNLLKNGIEI